MSTYNDIYKLIKSLVVGLIYALILFVTYVFIFPIILRSTLKSLDFEPPSLIEIPWFFILLFFIVVGSIASLFANKPYGMILRAFLNLLGFLILTTLLNGGIISVSTFLNKNVLVEVTADIRILLVTIFIVITVPSIILVIYEYVRSAEK